VFNPRKIAMLVALGVTGILLFVGLPLVREVVWGKDETTTSTSLPYDPELRAYEEDAVLRAMKVDSSRYDVASDTRFLEKLPVSETELEAAFRNRKTDRCEKILSGELLVSLEQQLPTPQASRPNSVRAPSTRRPAMSISLQVDKEDQASLPRFSKGQILEYLENSWLSLQARIVLEPAANEWRLHYRPLAAQANFVESTRTHAFESVTEKTLDDIRGLGLLKPLEILAIEGTDETPAKKRLNTESPESPATAYNERSRVAGEGLGRAGEEVLPMPNEPPPAATAEPETAKPADEPPQPSIRNQTAVWLFRFDRKIASDLISNKEYELVFVHLRPKSENAAEGDPWEMHVIFTTEERTQFHHLPSRTVDALPGKVGETDLTAAVHFTKYNSGGLSPAQSVTRSVTVNQGKTYRLGQISEYLAGQQKVGDWQEHASLVVDGIIQGL
jgi:hypothetical protein